MPTPPKGFYVLSDVLGNISIAAGPFSTRAEAESKAAQLREQAKLNFIEGRGSVEERMKGTITHYRVIEQD